MCRNPIAGIVTVAPGETFRRTYSPNGTVASGLVPYLAGPIRAHSQIGGCGSESSTAGDTTPGAPTDAGHLASKCPTFHNYDVITMYPSTGCRLGKYADRWHRHHSAGRLFTPRVAHLRKE